MCNGSQKTSQNQTSTTTPSAQASALYGDVIGKATDASNGFQYDPSTGKNIANFTPDQLAAFSGVQGAQGTGQGNLATAGNLITQGASAITPEEIANYTNPHQQAVVDAAMAQAQRNNAVAQSTMRGNAASAQALGGNGVQVGQAQLAGEQGRNDNAMVANLMSQGYDRATALAQADKVRQQTGANQQMNLGQLSQNMTYADLQALLASGNAQQGQTQAVNDAASANATAKQMAPFQNAQWLTGIGAGIGPLTGGTTKSTGTATTSTPKGIGQYVGAGLTAASMLSDRRTKENSRIIGKTFDGQNVHEFNYKGSPKRQIGLMADEVRQAHPDAVGQHPSGFDMVDYGRATDDSAERGHFASGGSVDGFGGSGFANMWNELRPSAPMQQPQAMQFATPAAAPPSPSMQESAKLGTSARAGIDGILRKLSPSQGWNAGTTIEPTSGAGTGSLASLGSMFGFAPGGAVDFESFGDTANGRSKRHRLNDEFIGELGSSSGADPYYGIPEQGEAGAIPASESPWGMSGISPTYKGRTLADFIGGIPNMPERGYREPVADMGTEAMPTTGPDTGNGLTPMPERGARPNDTAPESGAFSIGDLAGLDVASLQAAPQAAAAPVYSETRNAAPVTGRRPIINAIEMQESGGRDDLVSSAGARGPMQIMPATARNPGYGIAPMKNINDPAENRRFGEQYFNAMLKEFKGDEQAALIAYNGGPARAKQWLDAGRDDRVLPAETSNYYKQVAERMASGEPGGPSRDVLGEPSRDVAGAGFTSQTGSLVERAMSPSAEPASAGYTGPKDKAVGGLLKSLFGKEFNPFNLTENERMSVMTAGLAMMSNGDIGGGGMKGIDFLNKANTADRDAVADAQKLRMQLRKDDREAKMDSRKLDLMGAGRWSLSPDGTSLINDASGETRATGARKDQADTPAMKEYALATRQGFDGTFTEFEQERKAQNVKGQLSGEIGARLGLGDQFIREFGGIRARVAKGFGKGDLAHSAVGGGELAATQRQIATGMDALVRMNTGAAMPASEEANYNNRYQISATDSNATKLAKLDKLRVDLQAAKQGIIDGNSGVTVRGGIAAQKDAPRLEQARDAIKRGAPRSDVIKQLESLGISAQGL